MFPYVEFGENDAIGSNFTVYADSYDGGTYICKGDSRISNNASKNTIL